MSWAAVFPGQGSQHIGMGHFLFENFKKTRERFEEASDLLSIDFKHLCFTGAEADLQLTHNTQPALLLTSVCAFETLQEVAGFKSVAGAGHSIGEYAALVTAQSLKFSNAIKAVRIRGEAMQKAVPVGEGGMCAVMGLNDNQILELCRWVENESGFKPLEPANFNSTGQIVISGRLKAIEWVQLNFKKEALTEPVSRVKFIPLKVSAPFHCSMMQPAEDTMRTLLSQTEFQTPLWPIVQNFVGRPETNPQNLRENVIRQVSAPVLWTQCVENLRDSGVTRIIEFGAGKVLAGLIKKIDSEKLQTFNFTSIEELKALEGIYATQR